MKMRQILNEATKPKKFGSNVGDAVYLSGEFSGRYPAKNGFYGIITKFDVPYRGANAEYFVDVYDKKNDKITSVRGDFTNFSTNPPKKEANKPKKFGSDVGNAVYLTGRYADEYPFKQGYYGIITKYNTSYGGNALYYVDVYDKKNNLITSIRSDFMNLSTTPPKK